MKFNKKHRLSRIQILLVLVPVTLVMLLGSVTSALEVASHDNPFYYVSPPADAEFVSPGTTIAIRSDQIPTTEFLKADTFSVVGNKSGRHQGNTVLAGDGRTVIFRPEIAFEPDERVEVTIKFPSRLGGIDSYTYAFGITEPLAALPRTDQYAEIDQLAKQSTEDTAPQRYQTAPPDLPTFSVEQWPGALGSGKIFVSMFDLAGAFGPNASEQVTSFMLIMDNKAELLYYDRTTFNRWPAIDFKKQPNGLLTYFKYAGKNSAFLGLDKKYQLIEEFKAAEDPETGREYSVDAHDLQIMSNGHVLYVIHDTQIIDMSEIFPGGSKETPVIGCIIQEVDEDDNVVFQWRSWDNLDRMPIRDTNQPLDNNPLGYIHCNSIEEDNDGNFLMSSRNLDEITKIDRRTAEIIWQMGGRKNEFKFVNDDGFSFQHDARRLENGNITLYDNAEVGNDKPSRGIEYRVDEVNKTVEQIAEFRNTPDTQGHFMGNMQRLANGNTVIGWGTSSEPVLSEFDENGHKLLEFSSLESLITYRSFRFPWKGYPTWPPVLVARLDASTVHLYFSWNGSTETTGYKVYGGRDQNRLPMLASVSSDGFETVYSHELPENDAAKVHFWYFKVVPFNGHGEDGPPSNYVYVVPGGDSAFLSVVAAEN